MSFDPTGAAAGAASNIGGSVVSGLFSSRQAKKQMEFQERMSSTAHQREVADLRAAGLNPILSGTGGMGATSAAGAAAQMPPMDPVAGANSALAQQQAWKLANATTEEKEWQAQQAHELTKQEVERTKNQKLAFDKLRADIQATNSAANLNTTENHLRSLGIPAAENLSNMHKGKAGAAIPYVDKSFEYLNSALGAARRARP